MLYYSPQASETTNKSVSPQQTHNRSKHTKRPVAVQPFAIVQTTVFPSKRCTKARLSTVSLVLLVLVIVVVVDQKKGQLATTISRLQSNVLPVQMDRYCKRIPCILVRTAKYIRTRVEEQTIRSILLLSEPKWTGLRFYYCMFCFALGRACRSSMPHACIRSLSLKPELSKQQKHPIISGTQFSTKN